MKNKTGILQNSMSTVSHAVVVREKKEAFAKWLEKKDRDSREDYKWRRKRRSKEGNCKLQERSEYEMGRACNKRI
jgi:hypothetical protein